MNQITSFSGKYRFLSNFWPAKVRLDGEIYPSVEHAYVAAKSTDPEFRKRIKQTDRPGDAKKLGRRLTPRPDWYEIRVRIMEDLVRQKFNDPGLKEKLLSTGREELVEENTWGDTFWGVCRGVGDNHLGKMLMKIRAELQDEHASSGTKV